MKQNLILASLLLITTYSFAQSSNTKVGYGIKAGLNFSGATIKDLTGEKVTSSGMKTGVYVGFYADVPLSNKWFFQPGLAVSNKGLINRGTGAKATVSATYAEVPLNFIYKVNGQDGGFFIGGGMYAAYGLTGTVKERSNSYNESTIQFASKSGISFNYSKNRFYLKPVDAGVSFLMGFETKSRILFQVSAQAGIANQAENTAGVDLEASKYKNYGFGVALGYRF
ncbi:MAG: PorT family protein [Sphingobacteriales bacterium]|nr:PorT family protein [Sphingobacteriales bacterium]MBI3720388.1 PorT family protein [Sphingobacteriales bacterium]